MYRWIAVATLLFAACEGGAPAVRCQAMAQTCAPPPHNEILYTDPSGRSWVPRCANGDFPVCSASDMPSCADGSAPRCEIFMMPMSDGGAGDAS